MILLGIDPDLNGGFATVDLGQNSIVTLHRMPIFEPPVKGKRAIDMPSAYQAIAAARGSGATYVILEAAVVKPQVGKNGPVMMGGVDTVHQNYGGLKAICEVLFGRSRVIRAWPSTWKKETGLGSDKEESLRLAAALYPSHSALLAKKKNAGLAEAILLTEWGKKLCT